MPGHEIGPTETLGIALKALADDDTIQTEIRFEDAQEVVFRMEDVGEGAANSLVIEWTDSNGNTDTVTLNSAGGGPQ